MTRAEGLAILLDAGLSPNGLLLHTSNPQAAVNALERVRKLEKHPGTAGLAFRRVNWPDGNLVVVKVAEPEADAPSGFLPPQLKGLEDL
jgi:hypothetical protein